MNILVFIIFAFLVSIFNYAENKLISYDKFLIDMESACNVNDLETFKLNAKNYPIFYYDYIISKLDLYLEKSDDYDVKLINNLIDVFDVEYESSYIHDVWVQYQSYSQSEKVMKINSNQKIKNGISDFESIKEILNGFYKINDKLGILKILQIYFDDLNYNKKNYINFENIKTELNQFCSEFDVARINIFLISFLLRKGNISKSYQLILDTEPMALKYKDYITIARLKMLKGEICSKTGYFDKANEEFQESLKLIKELKLTEDEASISTSLGNLYLRKNDLNSAENYFNSAFSIYSKVQNAAGKSRLLNNLGVVYDRLGRQENAKNNFLQSIEIAKNQNNFSQLGESYNNFGNFYLKNSEYDKSIDSYTKSISFSKQVNLKDIEIKSLHNLGVAYYLTGKKNNAISSIAESLTYSSRFDMDLDAMESSFVLAKIYQEDRNIDKAKLFYNKSLEIAKKLKNFKKISEIDGNLKNLK